MIYISFSPVKFVCKTRGRARNRWLLLNLFGIRRAIDLFYSSKNFWCPPPLLLLLSSWMIAPQPFMLSDFEPTFVKQL
jgi:hypothetical protein